MEEDWQNGLCSCDCGTCMGAWCCSCFLFGRSADRMKVFPNTDKQNFHLFNGDCALFFAASCFGFGWLPLFVKRTELRESFHIQGNTFKDCCVAYWCTCCSVSQLECELKKRAQYAQLRGDPTPMYVSDKSQMTYAPPAYAPPAQVTREPQELA